MKFFTENIVVLGRVTAFLFLVASSGFTTFLHICTMEATECCDTSGATDHQACFDEETPSPVAGASIQNINDCHINTVAGGLAAIQALQEKDSKELNVNVLALLVSTFIPVGPNANASSFDYSYSDNVSPPSVEKYVLNETFLI